MVGLSVAWLLQGRGHAVTLVDPAGNRQPDNAGSSAALGLLMAQVYRRSSGRGWRLRQRSLELWQAWRQQLQGRGAAIPWRPGLLQLAKTADDHRAQAALVQQRQARGVPLELWGPERLSELLLEPPPCCGALWSPLDGQLDPLAALAALRADASRLGLVERLEPAKTLRRGPTGPEPWRVELAGGEQLSCSWLVVCAGLASPALLQPLGHDWPQSPVLGQALELQLAPGDPDPQLWPGSLSWGGVNLVPRPEGRLWLGATLEPDQQQAGAEALQQLRRLDGAAPPWLQRAQVLRHWQGLRARPEGRPAPLLTQLEPGLLLASGHYRNGVLLAPATAEWVAQQIEAGFLAQI